MKLASAPEHMTALSPDQHGSMNVCTGSHGADTPVGLRLFAEPLRRIEAVLRIVTNRPPFALRLVTAANILKHSDVSALYEVVGG